MGIRMDHYTMFHNGLQGFLNEKQGSIIAGHIHFFFLNHTRQMTTMRIETSQTMG